MVNTKHNRTARNTEETIVRAFYAVFLRKKNNISKVTVREICEEAHINRTTFYAHFQDVYDVLEKAERQMAQGMMETFLKNLEAGEETGECFVSLFSFVKENREFYAIYFNSARTSSVIELMREVYTDRMKSLTEDELTVSCPEELDYRVEFYMAGIKELLRKWVNTGCRESPRMMWGILKRALEFR